MSQRWNSLHHLRRTVNINLSLLAPFLCIVLKQNYPVLKVRDDNLQVLGTLQSSIVTLSPLPVHECVVSLSQFVCRRIYHACVVAWDSWRFIVPFSLPRGHGLSEPWVSFWTVPIYNVSLKGKPKSVVVFFKRYASNWKLVMNSQTCQLSSYWEYAGLQEV